MWKRIEKPLKKIIPVQITNTEKALGLQPTNKKEENATILRNWVTFSLRHLIREEERRAYHIPDYHLHSVEKFFTKFNQKTQEELRIKSLQYAYRGLSAKFKEIVTINKVVAYNRDGEYTWIDIM